MHTRLLGALIFAALGCNGARAERSAIADLVLLHGKVYTVNPAHPVAEAVAVKGDKIVAVGKSDDIAHLAGKATKVVELNGATVIPGFKDSHAHLLELGFARMRLDLTGAADFDEVVARVKQAAQHAAPGSWIVGQGWHEGKWTHPPADAVKGLPVNAQLNAVTPENPVSLERADGHAVLVNAKALALMHITSGTPAPAGGEIIHDSSGEPTGILVDDAMDLIKRPEPSVEEKRQAWAIAFRECLEHGVTAVDEAGTGFDDIALLKQLGHEGKIPIRLYAMVRGWETLQHFDKPEVGLADGHLTIRAVKLFADGALGSRGAAMLAPYDDDPKNSGLIVTPVEELKQAMAYARDHGFQVATHAIGDRGNRMILDFYEQALAHDPQAKNRRWRVEHAQILSRQDIPRFAQLGVIASMQTIHATSDRPWAPDRIGIERVKEGAYVWRKLLATGAHIADGTDAPVESIDPIRNYYAAVTRMDEHGNPPGGFDPEEKMTREEALRAYTLEGAYATFTESEAGSIEVGKNADLAVLSQDIMTVPAAEILHIEVLKTVAGGKVYERVARK